MPIFRSVLGDSAGLFGAALLAIDPAHRAFSALLDHLTPAAGRHEFLRPREETHTQACGWPEEFSLMETGEALKVCMLPDETCA